jgi:hypothetical protein
VHHKRKRPKHQRAGCLVCKAQKDERQPRYNNKNGWKRPLESPRQTVDRELQEIS